MGGEQDRLEVLRECRKAESDLDIIQEGESFSLTH